MKKLVLLSAIGTPLVIVVIIIAIVVSLAVQSGNNALAASADSPERIAELMELKAIGVLIDIVMMVTTYLCENPDEELTKPFIYPALEFLIMTEEVKEYTHYCDDDYEINEDGEYVSTTDHSDCRYEVTEVNTYEHRSGIENYIRTYGEASPALTVGNFRQVAQAAADARSRHSSVDDIRTVSFDSIAFIGYEDAIRRCGVEDETDVQGILELHTEGYFLEWLNELAQQYGVDPGESYVISGGTHGKIQSAMQRPDLVNTAFYGGSAIIPVPSGTYSISSRYGPRDFAPDPFHTGLDFAAAPGTPIYSVMDGEVLMRVTNLNSYGHHIIVFHGGGVTTMYAHMSAFGSYKAGDSVKKGDIIGYVGNSGLSTGPHLHLEYQRDGQPLDPESILSVR